MARHPPASLNSSEFNAFLFAYVGEEKNGMQLTVLSAMARLGFDPWEEAARLSRLPKEAAARALAAAIAALPEGDWQASDATAIAARLLDCLPGRGSVAAPADKRSVGGKTGPSPFIWAVRIALAAGVLLALWHLNAAPASDLGPGPVTSTQPWPLDGGGEMPARR